MVRGEARRGSNALYDALCIKRSCDADPIRSDPIDHVLQCRARRGVYILVDALVEAREPERLLVDDADEERPHHDRRSAARSRHTPLRPAAPLRS